MIPAHAKWVLNNKGAYILHPQTRQDWFVTGGGLIRKNLVNWDDDKPKPGVRVALYSAYNEKYDCLAEIAEANWAEYCRRHNYALRTYPGGYHEDPSRPETYGDKGKYALYDDIRGLFDVVMFLDIDSLFTNMNVRIEDRIGDLPFFWTYDDSGPLSGLIIARTDDMTKRHLAYAYQRAATDNNVRHGKIEPNGISDQDAMTRLMNVPPFSETFKTCFGAAVVGHCFPQNWYPGAWIIGFPGMPVEEKLRLMREWSARAIAT